jgi:pilus assembly protein Flp/PilA
MDGMTMSVRSPESVNVLFSGDHAMKFYTAAKKFAAKYITRKEEGASLAEYGLLLALIAVVCITAIALVGTQISKMFSTVSGSI